MPRVLLSHADVDKPAARRIADALHAAGHEPWLDEVEILPGASIPAAVARGLRRADFVVLCLSKAAAESRWIEAELNATVMQELRERKGRILPVRLDDVTPPGIVSDLVCVDLFPDDDAFRRAIAQITSAIERAEEPRAAPAKSGDVRVSMPSLGERLQSFLTGIGRALDIGATMNGTARAVDPPDADLRAVEADWSEIANDWRAIWG